MSELDRKIVRGSAWLALSYGGAQLVTLVVTAVLAHFVAPSAFGLVAVASIVIAVSTTVQESGLGMAVIHKRDDVERAAGTTFVFSVVLGFVLYAISFVLAPLVAHIFGEPQLTEVLRVLTLMLIPRGIGALPGVLIERELSFASRARGELAGVAVQAATAIPLAVAGAGVWSLVAGQLAGTSASAVVYWLVAPFRPSPRLFSWRMLRELARYGRHVTSANILFLINGNLDTATVARLLNAADVGYYNLAWRLCNLPATGIGYIVGRAMFPAYATLQADKPAFRAAFVANVRRVAIFSLPVGVGIFLAAKPIILVLFGSTWSPAIAPLQILAFFGIIRSFAGTTGAVLQAAGRPHFVTLLNVFHLAVLCATLFTLTPAFGLKGAALAMTLTALASLLPAYRLALRILELPLRDFVRELWRPVLCSVPLAVVLALVTVSVSGTAPFVRLMLLVGVGVAVYALSVLTIARGEVKAITSAFRAP